MGWMGWMELHVQFQYKRELILNFHRYLHIITPHTQREWGKVIGVGVLIIYICLWTKKTFVKNKE